MSSEQRLGQGWLTKAASDIAAAHLVVNGEGPYDTACFHAQQAIEKSLKALLALHGQPIPSTHDLDELQRLCLATADIPGLVELDLTEATDYGVMVRYDLDFWPDLETAADALILASDVFRLMVQFLAPEDRPQLPEDV